MGDLAGLCEAPGRDLALNGSRHRLEIGFRQAELAIEGGRDRPGADGVHTDTARDQLTGESAGKGKKGSLGGCVDARVRHTDVRVDGGVEHNGRRIREDRQECLNEEIRSFHIDRKGTVERGLVPLLDIQSFVQASNIIVTDRMTRGLKLTKRQFGLQWFERIWTGDLKA